MQNQVQIFENKEFGKLEVLMVTGKPHFPATECAKILGYKDTINAVKQHCRGVVKHHLIDSLGRKQQANFIPEGDLYRLIIRSKLPAAIRFEAWVCDEVLPSIRKHGAYITEETLRRMLEDDTFTNRLLHYLSVEQAKNQVLMERVGELRPKAQYYDTILQSPSAVPISIIAKDYGMSAAPFNKLLHVLGVQYKISKTWLLYKDYAAQGYTISKTYSINGVEASVHTCWTQKGRLFLYDLLKWYGILPEAEKEAERLVG